MKVKLIIGLLGILGCHQLVFAANQTHAIDVQKKHQPNYKDELSLPPICVITPTGLILNDVTQNTGRALPNPCKPWLFNRIAINAAIVFDGGKWGAHRANYQGENYQHFSLNDANLNVTATVNDWISAFTSINFNTATTHSNPSAYRGFGKAEYDAAYSNNINGSGSHSLQVEQAFATLGNFDVMPVYLQAGKQYADFSRYTLHPITESLTQTMSEILATSGKFGFITHGFNGSLFYFKNAIRSTNDSHNGGIAFGYDDPDPVLGFRIGAAYLYNLMGANNVAYQIVNIRNSEGYWFDHGFSHRRVGAIAAYTDVNAGPFTLGLRYTQALQSFTAYDLPGNGVAGLTTNTIFGVPFWNTNGAKPWAAGAEAGYHFTVWRDQNLRVGYQTSRQSAGLQLPKHRWLVGYGIDILRHLNLGAEWDYDRDYNHRHGGTARNSNLVSLRADLRLA